MKTYAKRTALIAALALTACSKTEKLEDPAELSDPVDVLSTVNKEMIEPFTGIDLASEPPAVPADHPELEIETLSPGEGATIQYGMFGKFHVIGSTADGSVFMNTWKGDDPQPVVLRVYDGIMPTGLAIAVDGAMVGERRGVQMPPSLGFGDKPDFSQGAMIPANSRLTYDIELVEIVDGPEIQILAEGDGDVLKYGETGSFRYTGVRATDGVEFDSTGVGEPRSFAVRGGGVIDGWAYGLPGMRVGEKRRMRIPSELAYGETGRGTNIPGDTDLVFDIELVDISR